MRYLNIIVPIAGIIALLVQAGLCVFTPKRPFSIGVVNVLLAAAVGLGTMAVFAGHLVVGSDLGVVMARGKSGVWLVRLALIATAVVPGLCWYRIRRLNTEWKSYLWAALFPSLAFGCWAATRVYALNPDAPEVLRVYSYDVWWPPLIMWLTVCFTGSVLALVKEREISACTTLTASMLVPLASFAIAFEDMPDPQSRISWLVLERLAFAAAMALYAWAILENVPSPGPTEQEPTHHRYKLAAIFDRIAALVVRQRVQISLTAGALVFGIGYAMIPNARIRALVGLIPSIPLLLILLFNIREQAIESASTTSDPTEPSPQSRSTGPAIEAVRGLSTRRVGRVQAITLALAFPLIAAGVVDLFSMGYVDPTVELAVLLIAWLLLAEHMTEGALDNLPSFVQMIREGKIVMPFQEPAAKAARTLAEAVKKSLQAVSGYFTSGGKWAVAVKALLVPILLLFALTIGTEILNSGKTVIQQFRWTGEKAAASDVSPIISDALINALGRMRRDLQPDLTISSKSSSDDHSSDMRLLTAGTETDSLGTAVSGDLEFSGMKIPLSSLVAPLQHLARSILGVREIGGSVRITSNGQYLVLANSSDGESWREFATGPPTTEKNPKKDAEDKSIEGSSPADTPLAAKNGSAGKRPREITGDQVQVDECGMDLAHTQLHKKEDPHDGLTNLIDKLAFDIASSDPSFFAAGLTKNWCAFQDFRSGLEHFDNAVSQDSETELKDAIEEFREAVRQDRTFARAYYHLGLAMQRYHQPGAAVEAFRASITVNPDFVRGASEEASTLYDLEAYYPRLPDPLRTWRQPSETKLAALKIWSTVADLPSNAVSIADKQKSLYGICVYEYDRLKDGGEKLFYLPYFYCNAAQALSSAARAKERSSAQQRSQEAAILDLIGVSLDAHRRGTRSLANYTWACSADAFPASELKVDGTSSKLLAFGSTFRHASLKYYRRSLRLVPADPVVRCNAATALAYHYGSTQEMRYLERDSLAHIKLGFNLIQHAREAATASLGCPLNNQCRERLIAAGYFQHALNEFGSAIASDPGYLEALNGYADTYWLWRLNWLAGRASVPPAPSVGILAEQHAREAVRLTQVRKLPDDRRQNAFATLGEVLLGQGRTTEAIEQLQNAVANDTQWQGVDEAHWDLAQANICASASVQGKTTASALMQQALAEYRKIREKEDTRELRPFTNEPDFLDPLYLSSWCSPPPNSQTDRTLPFLMRKAEYGAGPGCDWSGVVGKVIAADQRPEGFSLHVWGGGYDQRIPLSSTAQHSIRLEVPPKDRQFYFFAQLENRIGFPLSAVESLVTYSNPGHGGCSRNQVTLTFEKVQKSSMRKEHAAQR